MSTSASLDARSHNREHPTPCRDRVAGSAPPRGPDDRGASHDYHPDPEVAHLHAVWADVAVAIVARRAVRRQDVAPPTSLGPESAPVQGRRPSEAA